MSATLRVVPPPAPAGDQLAHYSASIDAGEARYFIGVCRTEAGYQSSVSSYPDDVPVSANPVPTAEAALLLALMAVCRHMQGRR